MIHLIKNKSNIIDYGILILLLDIFSGFCYINVMHIGIYSASGVFGPTMFITLCINAFYIYHIGKYSGSSKTLHNTNQFP